MVRRPGKPAPAGGWPVGNYQITFSGKGATKTVDFTVIDGATTTVPLPYSNTASNAAQQTRQPVGSETTQSIGSAATQSSNTGRGVIVGMDGAAYGTGSNTTVCTPIANTPVWVYRVNPADNQTLIANSRTDANGKFTFNWQSGSQEKTTVVKFLFDHMPVKIGNITYGGFINEDGISTTELHTPGLSAGPGYEYTLCLGDPLLEEKTKNVTVNGSTNMNGEVGIASSGPM